MVYHIYMYQYVYIYVYHVYIYIYNFNKSRIESRRLEFGSQQSGPRPPNFDAAVE